MEIKTRNTNLTCAVSQRWESKYSISVDEVLLKAYFRRIYTVTNFVKLRSFQFRVMHNALVLNTHLYRWGLRSDNQCSFCGSEKETLTHLLYLCEVVQALWKKIKEYAETLSSSQVHYNLENIIWNTVANSPQDVNNVLCLITKAYIYKQRCLDLPLNFVEIKCRFNTVKCIEKYVARKNNKLNIYYKKWESGVGGSLEGNSGSDDNVMLTQDPLAEYIRLYFEN